MVSHSTLFWWDKKNQIKAINSYLSSLTPAQVTTEKKKPVSSCGGFVGRKVDKIFIQTLLYTLQDYKATYEEFTIAFDLPDCWASLKGGSDLNSSEKRRIYYIIIKIFHGKFQSIICHPKILYCLFQSKKMSKKLIVSIKQRQKML